MSSAAVGIERDGRIRTGERIADLAGKGERPDPADRKVAQAFAEIKRRRVGGEPVGADILRAAAAPFDIEADRHDEFVLGVLVDAVLEGRLQILKATGAEHQRAAGRIKMRPGRRYRNGEILGDAFGIFAGNIEFFDGRTSPVLNAETVGSDNSSATPGSSMASVAGNMRLPTISWPRAALLTSAAATPQRAA